MFENRVRLFKLLGFEVHVDFSWIIIAVLVAWSLSAGLFPFQYKGLSTADYWIMGIAGTLGLFLSIIFHELSHSLVARRFGMPMKGITLFIFGGVAEMEDEPPNAKAEFMMAAAGPLASIAIGLVLFGISRPFISAGLPVTFTGVLAYLAYINLLLAAFNLVPAFPLDGGRILRSILWGVKNNLRWATRVSSAVGTGFAGLLIMLGVVQFLRGNFVGGMWWFLIGMFLYKAARSSYHQLLTRRTLEGEKVERFMEKDPVTVDPSLSIHDLVEDYIYRYHYKMFPVVSSGQLVGCITTREVQNLPREEWENKTVGEAAVRCSEENTIDAKEDAMKALSMMNRSKNSRLMVVEDGRLVGIISLKDMLKFLSLRVELEE